VTKTGASGNGASSPSFDVAEALKDLRAVNGRHFETALNKLRTHILEVKQDVFQALQHEADPHVKGALIELLGDSRDPAYIPCLAAELEDCRIPEVRFWALAALQRIGTADAMSIVKKSDLQRLAD